MATIYTIIVFVIAGFLLFGTKKSSNKWTGTEQEWHDHINDL